MFDAEIIKNDVVKWIKDWFNENGKGCNAVVGISGGKDSTVVAALCKEALGPDRVIGVMLPDWIQSDIDDSREIIRCLGIHGVEYNIGAATEAMLYNMDTLKALANKMGFANVPSQQSKENLPPRIRMAALYMIAQSFNGRVSNNCNLSENWIGYSTIYGDTAGDFAPISCFTVSEVKEIGRVLGLPDDLIDKVPTDGLCGKTDEDNLGFTYDVLDKYIRTGEIEDREVKKKIDMMHEKNLFKLQLMPSFQP